jgi:hypothetical protein
MLLVLYYIWLAFSSLCYLYYIIFGLLSSLYVTCIILYLVYFDVDSIYLFELEIKDTTDIDTSASYFGQHQEINQEGTKLYDKKKEFRFSYFPSFICSNILAASAYGAYI